MERGSLWVGGQPWVPQGGEMNYIQLLEESARDVGNCACMGLDPQLSLIPQGEDGDVRKSLNDYFTQLFRRMSLCGLAPAAFKPNIGYYVALDNPRDEDFCGSLALGDVLDLVENFFPSIPIILDSKRGDIARSSQNYAIEAFDKWRAQAVTVAPYMGSDSIQPFVENYGNNGIYILDRTSNPGGKDLQNAMIDDTPLYLVVASHISDLSKKHPGVGAVVGATNMDELKSIVSYYHDSPVPLLIPGVGSQGGSAQVVVATLRSVGYPLSLVRVNSSSGLTHPWKKAPVPEDWLDQCIENIRLLIQETSL